MAGTASPTPASFFFDLASPLAYLAAERVLRALGSPARWCPVAGERLPGGVVPAFRCQQELDVFRAEVERRALALHLQPLRWPPGPLPFDSSLAMRVATYARSIGRAVPFAQAAFRQAYAGGRSLADPDSVLIAAAACEMHPAAVLKAAELGSVAQELERETERARGLGVTSVPAVAVGDEVFEGERALEQAAERIRAAPCNSAPAGAGDRGAAA
jgi:2-hydroxychromene-2-carboxylate isomerase